MGIKGTSLRKDQSKRYYERHREDILAKRTRERENPKVRNRKRGHEKELQEYVIEQKHMQPCVDCQECFPHFVLDFDHVRGIKVANVARLVSQCVSLEMIRQEIAKCAIVCANCHRFRTFA